MKSSTSVGQEFIDMKRSAPVVYRFSIILQMNHARWRLSEERKDGLATSGE